MVEQYGHNYYTTTYAQDITRKLRPHLNRLEPALTTSGDPLRVLCEEKYPDLQCQARIGMTFLDIENVLGEVASRTCAIYTKCDKKDCRSTDELYGTALGIEHGIETLLKNS